MAESARDVTVSNRQRLFLRYFTAILLDLVVLGLFAQHWDRVHVETFTTALLAAVLLQALLKVTLAIEHRVASFFAAKGAGGVRVMRVLSTWAVLLGSKFLILYALQFAFGERIRFDGAFHGIVPLIVVLVAMVLSEAAIVRVYRALA